MVERQGWQRAVGSGVVRHLLFWAGLPLAGAVVLGAWPTWRLAGAAGLTAMGVGSAISLIGALAGSLVSAAGMARRPELAGYMTMAAASVRFGVALVLGAAVALIGLLDIAALLLWVVISYLALLGGETAALVRMIRRNEAEPAK